MKKDIKQDLNGLNTRQVDQIIRRKMMQKDHGDAKKYNRKQKHKGDGQEE